MTLTAILLETQGVRKKASTRQGYFVKPSSTAVDHPIPPAPSGGSTTPSRLAPDFLLAPGDIKHLRRRLDGNPSG
jgi:hypothetical protein